MLNLEDVKSTLGRRREELRGRIEAIENDIRRRTHGGLSEDSEERAQEQENDEVLDALDDRAREELQSVEKALQRLGQGDYLICAKCGENIGEERLANLPYADRCIQCAQ